MREIQYKDFSLKTHQKNWQVQKPNVCQFELTFGCGLHCWHCYTDCYNKPQYIEKELNTRQVKSLLDKVYNSGVVWLCFTGGDPLSRNDFLDIYSYAKDKGFIVTIFTNGYSITDRIADYLKKKPPFVIELTLNAISKKLYESISGVSGSFERVMLGINLIKKYSLPLKIKTQITKNNLRELPKIKKFIEKLRLNLRPSVFLHARLDGELIPCSLRIPPQDVLNLNGRKPVLLDDCKSALVNRNLKPNPALFRCAITGRDGINIDPYGNTFPCNCIREPSINLLKKEIKAAREVILSWVRTKQFIGDEECSICSLRKSCLSCPGKALLEKGSLTAKVGWYCELAHLIAIRNLNA